MWRAQVDHLSAEYRCIAPALWGHGGSDPVDGDCYDLETLTDDMVAFVDALGLDSWVMAGLSVGGMWGARLAHRLPDRVRGLVLMDTDLGAEPEESGQRFLGMIAMARQAGCLPPPLVEACLPFFLCDETLANQPDIVNTFKASLLGWDASSLPGVMAVGEGIFTRSDFLPQLAAVTCPACVVVGEQDRSRPVHEAERLAATLGDAPLEIVPGAGHIPAVEQPARVNAILDGFLAGLD